MISVEAQLSGEQVNLAAVKEDAPNWLELPWRYRAIDDKGATKLEAQHHSVLRCQFRA